MELLSYSEGMNKATMVLEIKGVMVEITAYKGMFGNIAISYRVLEPVEEVSNANGTR